jgi:hypothetical protein
VPFLIFFVQLIATAGKEGRLTVAGKASAPIVAQLDKLGVDMQFDLTLTNGDISIFSIFFLKF